MRREPVVHFLCRRSDDQPVGRITTTRDGFVAARADKALGRHPTIEAAASRIVAELIMEGAAGTGDGFRIDDQGRP